MIAAFIIGEELVGRCELLIEISLARPIIIGGARLQISLGYLGILVRAAGRAISRPCIELAECHVASHLFSLFVVGRSIEHQGRHTRLCKVSLIILRGGVVYLVGELEHDACVAFCECVWQRRFQNLAVCVLGIRLHAEEGTEASVLFGGVRHLEACCIGGSHIELVVAGYFLFVFGVHGVVIVVALFQVARVVGLVIQLLVCAVHLPAHDVYLLLGFQARERHDAVLIVAVEEERGLGVEGKAGDMGVVVVVETGHVPIVCLDLLVGVLACAQ